MKTILKVNTKYTKIKRSISLVVEINTSEKIQIYHVYGGKIKFRLNF